MADVLLLQKSSREIAHDLVDIDHDLSAGGDEAARLDMRIDETPLPSPVLAHGLATVHEAAVSYSAIAASVSGAAARRQRLENDAV